MTREEALLEAIQQIVPEKAEVIRARAWQIDKEMLLARKPRNNIRGALKDLKCDLSFEDFQAERREMWKNFPRDVPEAGK